MPKTIDEKPDYYFVRLKPYNPKRGHTLKTLMFAGFKYRGDVGWYRVPAKIAVKLAEIPQTERHPFGEPAFDIVTEDEAAELDAYERALKEEGTARRPVGLVDQNGVPRRVARPRPPEAALPQGTRPMASAGALTTADLPGHKNSEPEAPPAPAPVAAAAPPASPPERSPDRPAPIEPKAAAEVPDENALPPEPPESPPVRAPEPVEDAPAPAQPKGGKKARGRGRKRKA